MSTRTPEERERDDERIELALLGKLVPEHDRIEHTKVVGVTATNSDGTNRQELVKKVRQFDEMELVRNPNDNWDRNAIKVMAQIGGRRVQIGHIDGKLAAIIAPGMDRGDSWGAVVTKTGGRISLGVSLMLFRRK